MRGYPQNRASSGGPVAVGTRGVDVDVKGGTVRSQNII